MNFSIASNIADLLYERDLVIVPGLGGFESKYRSAQIDHVQGKIHPPSKTITFNPNLTIDDGALANYIATKYDVPDKEASQAVELFVNQQKERLSKREIISIPDVGRLYLDFEKKLQFLPDNTNFNKDAFGLPTIQAYPVTRDRATLSETIEHKIPPKLSKPVSGTRQTKWIANQELRQLFPWLVAASIIVLVASFWVLWPRLSSTEQREISSSKLSQVEPRLNKKPSPDHLAADTSAAKHPDTPAVRKNEVISEAESTAQDEDIEAPTLAPGLNEGIIIIGGFKDKANAQQLIQRLYKNGYEAYSDRKGSLTRVGVRFGYKKPSEIEDILLEIQERYNENAWVLSR